MINAFYGVMQQVINGNTLTTNQITCMEKVEKILLANGLEFDSVKDNDKFITVVIRKTANFKIYTYIRKINRLFSCCIHRKQHIEDKNYFYVNVKKDKLQ